MVQKNYIKKSRLAILCTVFLFIILTGLIFNKINTEKYNGKVNVASVKIDNKLLSNSKGEASIDEEQNKTLGNSIIEYNINYMLETIDDSKINNRTAIIDVNLSDNDINYATFELLNEKNITSKILNNGKTMQITVTNIMTNKNYELSIKIKLTNAPNDYKITPNVNVREKTSEVKESYAKTVEVQTNSIEGTAVDSESSNELSFVPISICKIDEVGCIDKKITYTNENGNYSFSDLEIGKYEIGSSEDDESSKTEIDISGGNNNANIIINSNNLFKATINKYVKKIELVESGNSKTYDYNKLNKVALSVKNMKNASLRVIYEFEISNNSKKSGFIKVVKEDIPESMELDKSYEANKEWIEADKYLYNKTLSNTELNVGETRTLEIALKTKSTDLARNYLNNVNINGEVYHTVNFIYEDEVIYQEVVLDTDLVTNHTIPEKEGLTIAGWFTDKSGKNKFNFNTPIQNDINLYAVNQIDKVDVTLINKLKPYTYVEEVNYGDKLKEPNRDNKVNGYTFRCWQILDDPSETGVYEENDFDKNLCYDFSKPVTKPMTLIATYTINSYKIRFLNKNSEGEYVDYHTENMTSPFETNYGTVLSEPVPEPKQDLSDFIGWFESSDEGKTFNNTSYNFNNKVDRDITLYSVFDKDYKYYKVTFVVQDTSTVVRVKANELVEKPDDPEIKGYEFDGWYETDTYSTDEFDFNTPITKNITLYAKLDEKSNNVTFKEPYENPITDNETDEENFEVTNIVEVEYGDTVEKPLDPERKCKKFLGWFEKDEDGNFKKEPFSFDTIVTKEIILYALFETKDVTIRFENESGELIEEEQIIACGTKPVVPTPDPVPGKEFTCWEEKGQEECSDPDTPQDKDKTFVTRYDDIAKVNISHEPTTWTNKNVLVTITMPDVRRVVDKKTIEKVLEDGTVITTTTEEEREIVFDNKEDYDIEYRIDDGNYQKYTDEFEMDKNCTVEARLKKRKTNEIGESTSHLIDNIDKVSPRIDDLYASDISFDKFTVNLSTTDLNDIEKVSGIANIKFYLLGSEDPFYDEDFGGNISESTSATIDGLMESTEYTVRTVITDIAGNITDDSSLKVTTREGTRDIVARIISLNGGDLDEANYIEYSTLNSAIYGVKGSDGTITKAGCLTLGPKCTIQMLKSVNESATIPSDYDITLDLNGKRVSNTPEYNNLLSYNLPVTSATLINDGAKLTIIDNHSGDIGAIQNIEASGVGIFNTNKLNSILSVGIDEGEDNTASSVVSMDKPIVKGTINGVYNSKDSIFNFYDGKIMSTSSDTSAAPVFGEVTKTPYKYNASILDTSSDPSIDPNTKVESLYILADAVARVDSTYYTHLNGDYPVTALKAASKNSGNNYIETNEKLISNNKSFGEYGFDYNSENQTLTSNNIGASSTIAESVVTLDLNSISNLPNTAAFQVKINASISSEENSDIGCIIINDTIDPVNSCSNTGIVVSGNEIAKDYIYPDSLKNKKTYYMHIIYQKNETNDKYEDKFQINNIEILPSNVVYDSAAITPGDYGFKLNTSGQLVSENFNIDGSMAYSYVPIDMTKYDSDKILEITGSISSEEGCDIGYIILSESTNMPSFGSEEALVEISGNNNYNKSLQLNPGKIYYLHFAYIKDRTSSESTDNFTIGNIIINEKRLSDFNYDNIDLTSNGNYGFRKDGNKLVSTNKGVNSSIAQSYIAFDLTGETSNKSINIDAEVSSERNYDKGFVIINDSSSPITASTSGKVFEISGESYKNYTGELIAGKINYVHIVYSKDSGGNKGDDTFTINNISTDAKTSSTLAIEFCTKKESLISTGESFTSYTKRTPINTEESEVKTIHLLQNVSIDSTFLVDADNELVLDLNGYGLTITNHDSVVQNNGILTVVDEQYEKTGILGNISNLGYRTISNNGTLNINEGNINSSDSGVNNATIVNYGVLNYKENAKISSTNGNAIYNMLGGNIPESTGEISQTGNNYAAIKDASSQEVYNNLNIKQAYIGINFVTNSKNKKVSNSEFENIEYAAINNTLYSNEIEVVDETTINSNDLGIKISTGTVRINNADITTLNSAVSLTGGNVNIISGNINSNNGTAIENKGVNSTINIGVKDANNDDLIIYGEYSFNNSGTININSGTLTSRVNGTNNKILNIYGGKTGFIFNNGNGTLIATGGEIGGITNNGNANLSGNIKVERSLGTAIDNYNTLSVSGHAEVIGKIGIQNRERTTLTLGENDDIVDSEYPKISATEYGVYNSDTFNYYDGLITGKKDMGIYNVISATPEFEDKKYDLNIETNNANSELEDISLKIPTKPIATIFSKSNEEKESYPTVQDAIDAFDTENDEIIKLVSEKDVRTVLTNNIQNKKDIKLDLNGKKIKMYKSAPLFTNEGTFTVIDDTSLLVDDIYTPGAGSIITYAAEPFNNRVKSNLNLDKVVVEDNGSSIVNLGNLNLTNTNIFINSRYSPLISNNGGHVEVNSGYLEAKSVRSNVIENKFNGQVVINGGVLTTSFMCGDNCGTEYAIISSKGTNDIQINGGTLRNNRSGYAIVLNNDSESTANNLTINNGNFEALYDYSEDIAIYTEGLTKLVMENGNISKYKIGMRLGNKTDATINNGKISDATKVIETDGNLIVNDGTFSSSRGFYLNPSSKATFNGGTINVGTSTGIYNQSMSDVTIRNVKFNGYGTAIYNLGKYISVVDSNIQTDANNAAVYNEYVTFENEKAESEIGTIEMDNTDILYGSAGIINNGIINYKNGMINKKYPNLKETEDHSIINGRIFTTQNSEITGDILITKVTGPGKLDYENSGDVKGETQTNILSGTVNGDIYNRGKLTLGIKGDNYDEVNQKYLPSKTDPEINGEYKIGIGEYNFYDGIFKIINTTPDNTLQDNLNGNTPRDTESGYSVKKELKDNYNLAYLDILPIAEITMSNGREVTENNLFYDDLKDAFINPLCESSCTIKLMSDAAFKNNELSNDYITINETQNINFNINGKKITAQDTPSSEESVISIINNKGTLKIYQEIDDTDSEFEKRDNNIKGNSNLKDDEFYNYNNILNSGNLTLDNIKIDTPIINNGTLNITNRFKSIYPSVSVDKDNSITNNYGGIVNFNVKETTNDTVNSQIVNYGEFNMKGGNINKFINGVLGSKIGTMNIESGKITSLKNGALSIVNLGKKDSNVSISSPSIKDLENDRLGTLNFYDGEITGDLIGSIEETEENYSVIKEENIHLTNDKAFEVNGNVYLKIKDALNDSSCKNDNECTIKLLKNVFITKDEGTVEFTANKNITLDLNGNKIYSSLKTLFKNYGEFTINDSIEGGEITSDDGSLIYNEGIFKLENGKLTESRGDATIINVGSGKVIMNDGEISASNASIVNLPKGNIKDASIEINGGTINSEIKEYKNLNNMNVSTVTGEYTTSVNLSSLTSLPNQVDSLIYNNINEDLIKTIFDNRGTIINLTNKVSFISGTINTLQKGSLISSSIYSNSGILNLHGGNINHVTEEGAETSAVNTDSTKIDFTSGTINVSVQNRGTREKPIICYGKVCNVKYGPLIGINTTNNVLSASGGKIMINRGISYIKSDLNIYQYNYTSEVIGIRSISEINISNIEFDLNKGTFNFAASDAYNPFSSISPINDPENKRVYTPNSTAILQNISSANIKGIKEQSYAPDYSSSIILKLGASLDLSTSASTITNKIVGETTSNIKVYQSATTGDIISDRGNLTIQNSKTANVSSNGGTTLIDGSNLGDTSITGTMENSYNSSFTNLSINSNSDFILGVTTISGDLEISGNGLTTIGGSTVSGNTSISNNRSLSIQQSNLGNINNKGKDITLSSGSINDINTSGNLYVETGTTGNIETTGNSNLEIKKGVTSTGNITHNSSGTANISGGEVGAILNQNSGTINISNDVVVNATSGIGIENAGSGSVNIGINDDTLSTTNPSITGSTYGIYGRSGTINFFDGIITGKNGTSILGRVSYDNSKYRILKTVNEDASESAILAEIGEIDSPIYANNQSFYDLQTAINSSPETSSTNPVVITITKDIELINDVIVPAGKYFSLYKCGHTINYNGFTITGEGTINIYDGNPGDNSVASDNSLGATVRELLNIDTPVKIRKNIIIYNTDNGKPIDPGESYELKFLTKDGKYETIDVLEDINNVGRYTVSSTNSDDILKPINGRIYINNIPDGTYKVIGSNKLETTFTIDEDGNLSGNAKINNTTNLTNSMDSSSAEVIVSIQTGKVVFKFGLLSTLITIIIGLLIMVSRKAINE